MIIEDYRFRVVVPEDQWLKYVKDASQATNRPDEQSVEEYARELVVRQAENMVECGAFKKVEMSQETRDWLRPTVREIMFREYVAKNSRFKGTCAKLRKGKPMSAAMQQDVDRLRDEFVVDESAVDALFERQINFEQMDSDLCQIGLFGIYIVRKQPGFGGERKGAGRKPKPVKMTTRSITFSPETLEKADRYASFHGISRSQVVEKAVQELLKPRIGVKSKSKDSSKNKKLLASFNEDRKK